MTEVPITQLGAMRDAKRCQVLVRGAEEDVELYVSRKQFRDVLECYGEGTGESAWTVCWVAETETAVLEPFGACESVPLRYEGVSQCDHCTGWFLPADLGDGAEGELICHDCWGHINQLVDRYGRR